MRIPDQSKYKLAIPNKGRLKAPAIDILEKAGFDFRIKDKALYASCKYANLLLILSRADDIPILVEQGVVHMGITGEDLVEEREADIEKMLELGFGQCRLCLAIPEQLDIKNITELAGKNIATCFPVMTKKYFKQHQVKINSIKMHGGLEIMIGLGLAQAIVDVVETGDSLKDNQLKVHSKIGSYQTSLFVNKAYKEDVFVNQVKRRLEGITIAKKYTLLEYNIPQLALKQAEIITPGYKSPTISRLEDNNWFAIRVMVPKKKIPEVMDELEKLGASAIMEIPIKNCRL